MIKNAKHTLLSAGLASILALGAMGCSSTSTTTTEVTDADGTTITETTSTTDEGGQTTTEQTAITDESVTYVNKVLGFQAVFPETFKHIEAEENAEGEETILFAADDKDDQVFIIARDMSAEPVFEGPTPWAEYFGSQMTAELEEDGETNITSKVSEGTFAGVPCMILELRSKTADGGELYRDYFFIVGDTADGLTGLLIGATAYTEDDLAQVENYFTPIEPTE